MSRERPAVRVYRALTRAYPRRFRDEYGADMVALFRDQCRDEPGWRVLPRAALDLAITIPTQHLEARMRRDASPLVPLIYLAVALAGLLLAIAGGTEPTTLAIGVTVALGAGAVGFVAWRRSSPARDATPTGSWWKLLVAGPCLVVVVILAAGAGVEAWYLGLASVLLALLLVALGLVLGVLNLVKRRTRGIPT
jgi:hypothetical protein